MKNQHRGQGEFPKKGEAWTVCRFKGGLTRKRGWCFWGRLILQCRLIVWTTPFNPLFKGCTLIVWNTPLNPLFKGGKWILITSPRGGGRIWKIKKGVEVWSMVGAGAGLLECWHFSYLIFSRFIIFMFRNYFILSKIVFCIWRKITFFCHHNFMKSCLKMNLEISHKLR